jgi:hypothetical protein
MNPLLALVLGAVGLGFLLRKRQSPQAPQLPAEVPQPPATPTPAATIPAVREVNVEGRRYVVTRYGNGQYKAELMGASGPVAAVSFGQTGAPIRTGDQTLIDKYVLKDIHKFPSDLFA